MYMLKVEAWTSEYWNEACLLRQPCGKSVPSRISRTRSLKIGEQQGGDDLKSFHAEHQDIGPKAACSGWSSSSAAASHPPR